MYLVLRFFKDENMENRVFCKRGTETVRNIINKCPLIGLIETYEIKKAFGLYINCSSEDIHVKELSILKIDIESDRINILFNIKKDLDYNCRKFDSALYELFFRKNYIRKGEFIPYAVLLNDEELDSLVSSLNKLDTKKYLDDKEEILQLKKENKWEEIYNYYGQANSLYKDHPEVWNDSSLLGEIGFAASKLAALSIIPKEIKNDNEKKRELLSEKKKYRDDAEMLYKRCVELEPQSASVYSNLAYIYYINVIELTTPGGRRDGNVHEEFNKAKENLNKALLIDNTRIRDLYRMGYLHSEIMSEIQKYNGNENIDLDNSCNAEELIKEGIKYFDRVIELWEALDDEDMPNSKKKNFKKDYIKALFSRGKAYQQLYDNYWNKVLNSWVLFNIAFDNIRAFSDRKYENYIKMAMESFEKCWNTECVNMDAIENENLRYINDVLKGWKLEAVDILYRLGYIYFDIFWYLMSIKPNGYKDKCSKYIKKAEKCFNLSDKVNWKEKGNQNKKFVHEKLARLYISTGRHNEAYNLLKKYSNSKDYYIINTLCFALYIKKDYASCINILKNIVDDKNNKCRNQSRMLLAMSYYKSAEYFEAKNMFETMSSENEKFSTWNARFKEFINDCENKAGRCS